jgi:hypothetical protein
MHQRSAVALSAANLSPVVSVLFKQNPGEEHGQFYRRREIFAMDGRQSHFPD